MLKNRKAGFYISLAALLVALLGAAAYLIVYYVMRDPVTGTWDRVFRWGVFGVMLGGAVVSALGELCRLHSAPIIAGALFGVGLAMHLTQAAYPIADVLTKVQFFGGNALPAIIFSAIFALAVILHVTAAFFGHEGEKA